MSSQTATFDVSEGRRLIAGRWLRWNEDRAQAAYAEGWWVRETLADAARRAASETPDHIILTEGSVQVSCRALLDEASAVAQALLDRFEPGSVISFMLPNWHETAGIYLGATLAGMIANPILPSLRDRELAFMLQDVESRMIFIPHELRGHDYVAMLDRVRPKLSAPPEVVVLRGDSGGHTPYDSLVVHGDRHELPPLDPDAVRMILYTSGTTGTPKGVLHSHNSMYANIRQIRQYWRVEPGDRFLVPSPISHIGGSIYAFETPLLLGASATLMDRWDADEAVRIALAQDVTHIAGATPFLEQMLAAAQRAGTTLPRLKLFICGGAAVPPSLIRSAAAYFDRTSVTRAYGSTEVPITAVGVLDRADVAHAADTDGKPGIAEVKLVPIGSGPAGEGEIRARGPQMLVGYIHPEDEGNVFDEEGFYRTGDLGRWVDGSYLVVSGRAKDIIIRKGENISPKEVEDVLIEHPDIAEVAIVGVPDPQTGERACAVIVAAHLPGPSVEALGAFLRQQGMATFKIPEQVEIWDSLPRNDAGKVLKHKIRSALTEQSRSEETTG